MHVTEQRTIADGIRKRAREARYEQDSRGRCILCKKNFQDCPHSFAEVDTVLRHIGNSVTLSKWGF